MARTILVFGASGVIGQGFIKVCLEKADIKVVGVFRSEESAQKTSTRLGNPSSDKFVTVIGNFGSEQEVADLQKTILDKVGSYTDVVSSIGGYEYTKTLLELTADNLKKVVWSDKILPHFLAAKYFLTPIQDKPDTSFTVINGGAAYHVIPGFGHMTLANGALVKLSEVLSVEYKDKPVRFNEYTISCIVTAWDAPAPENSDWPTTNSVEMGKGLLGLILHPNTKGASLNVEPKHLEKLAQEGTL